VLRTFRASDIAAVQGLIHRTIDVCYTEVYPPQAVTFFKRFHSLEAIRERALAGAVVVVEGESGLVATGARAGSEISGVFVAPEMQGRGIGALVMDELEADALAAGEPMVHLDVSLPSRGFYEGRGYVIQADRSIDVGEGQQLHYWEAEKPLAF
jgi:GNAT superfamily N-acetyltransferase